MKLELVKLDSNYWDNKKREFLSLFAHSPVEASLMFYNELLPFYFITYRKSFAKLPEVVSRLVSELNSREEKVKAAALVAKALYTAVDVDLLPVPLSGEDYVKPMEEEAVKLLPDLSKPSNVYKRYINALRKLIKQEVEDENFLLEFERYYRLYEILRLFKIGKVDEAIARLNDFFRVFPADLLGEFLKNYFAYFKSNREEDKRYEIIRNLQSLFPKAKEEKDFYLACRVEALLGEIEPTSAISYYEDVKDELLKLKLYYNLADFLRDKYLPLAETDPGVDVSGRLNAKLLAAEAYYLVEEREKAFALYKEIFSELLSFEDYNTLINIIEKTGILDQTEDEEFKRETLNTLLEAYKRVVSVNPSNISALSGYAKALEKAGKTEEAKEIYFKLGVVALREYEYYERAEEAFSKVLEYDPTNLEALNYLVDILRRTEGGEERASKLILKTISVLKERGREREAEEIAERYKSLLPSEEKQALEREKLRKLATSGDHQKFLEEAIRNLIFLREDLELQNSFIQIAISSINPENFNQLFPPLFEVISSLPSQEDREKRLRVLLSKLTELEMYASIKEILPKISLELPWEPSESYLNSLKPFYRLVLHLEGSDKEFLKQATKFYAKLSDKISKRVGLIAVANTLMLLDPQTAEEPLRILRETFPADGEILELELKLYHLLGDTDKFKATLERAIEELSDRKDLLLKIIERVIWDYRYLKEFVIEAYIDLLAERSQEEITEKVNDLVEELLELKRTDLVKLIGAKLIKRNVLTTQLQEILINIYTQERDISNLLKIADYSLTQVKISDGWLKALGHLFEIVAHEDLSKELLNTLISIFKVVLDKGTDEELRHGESLLESLFRKIPAISSLPDELKDPAIELLNILLDIRAKLGEELLREPISTTLSGANLGDLKTVLARVLELYPERFKDEIWNLNPKALASLITWDKLRENEELYGAFLEGLERKLEELPPEDRSEVVSNLIDILKDVSVDKALSLLKKAYADLKPSKLVSFALTLPEDKLSELPPDLLSKILDGLETTADRLRSIDLVSKLVNSTSMENLWEILDKIIKEDTLELLVAFSQVFASPQVKLTVLKSLDISNLQVQIVLNSLFGFWDIAMEKALQLNSTERIRALVNIARGLAAGGYLKQASDLYEYLISQLEDLLFSGEIDESLEPLVNVVKYEYANVLESISKERALEIYADLYISAPQIANLVKKKMEALQA